MAQTIPMLRIQAASLRELTQDFSQSTPETQENLMVDLLGAYITLNWEQGNPDERLRLPTTNLVDRIIVLVSWIRFIVWNRGYYVNTKYSWPTVKDSAELFNELQTLNALFQSPHHLKTLALSTSDQLERAATWNLMAARSLQEGITEYAPEGRDKDLATLARYHGETHPLIVRARSCLLSSTG